MINKQAIADEVAKIKQLRANYDALIMDINSHRTIEAYHAWYDESSVVFSHYFDDNCKEYSNFTSVDNNGNGYVLKGNYQKIRKDFCVLVDKLERGVWGVDKQTTVAPIQSSIPTSKKRIFISHASKDGELIGKFVDSIFLLGMGMDSEIIAYTSREDTGVPAGESIPQFIQENIACADIVLLMISDNYKNSEVCLNEMGAAWALNKLIIQVLLPNTSFDKLGWLCSLDKALKIDDADSIDGLCEVFTDKLDIGIKLSAWNRNKAAFISYCSTLTPTLLPSVIEPEVVEVVEDYVEEWGFLDYKEAFDADVAESTKICLIITNALQECTSGVEANANKIKTLNPQKPNMAQARGIMMATARVMDKLSEIQEENAPLLRCCFFNMVDNAIKMRMASTPITEEDMNSGFDSVRELIAAICGAKSGIQTFKLAVDDLPKAEKSIIKARKRLSSSLDNLIIILDDCIIKGRELISAVI